MPITLTAKQKTRTDTASNWSSANPTLLSGEIGYESDTGKAKVGDGSTAWSSLAYTAFGGLPKTGGTMTGAILGDNSTSASTPGYAFDGDANTGLLRTGADAVALVTGGTAAVSVDSSQNVVIAGTLQVSGTTTTVNSTTMTVADKNIEIAKGAANDAAADGAGITIDSGDGDKTITWTNSTDSFDFNQHVNIATGTEFKINNVSVLSATALGSSVVGSSLTSVGTIASGTWQGTAIGSSYMTAGTTSAVGAVQLEDSTTSTSTTKAATPASVKAAKDAADTAQTTGNAAVAKAGDTMTGNLVLDNDKELRLNEADSNGSAYVGIKGATDKGSDASYTISLPAAAPAVNQVLKAGSSTATDMVWATDTQGVTSVTGTAPIASSGGNTPAISISAATGSAAGSMSSGDYTKLSGIETSADVTDATNVAAAGAVMEEEIDAKGDLLAGTADNTIANLAVGTDGHYLKADSSTTTGLVWAAVSATDASKMPLAGGTFTGSVTHNDNIKAIFGSDADAEIYHDDTDFYIDNDKGGIYIRANVASDVGGDIYLKPHDNEDGIKIVHDGGVFLYYDNSAKLETVTGGVNVTGALTATGEVTAYSDERLKTDIQTIPNALEKVSKLNGVTYTRIDTEAKSTGVIAQEIEKVIPEVVHTDDKGIKSVAYGNIVGHLIEAIKELKIEIDELKGAV